MDNLEQVREKKEGIIYTLTKIVNQIEKARNKSLYPYRGNSQTYDPMGTMEQIQFRLGHALRGKDNRVGERPNAAFKSERTFDDMELTNQLILKVKELKAGQFNSFGELEAFVEELQSDLNELRKKAYYS